MELRSSLGDANIVQSYGDNASTSYDAINAEMHGMKVRAGYNLTQS